MTKPANGMLRTIIVSMIVCVFSVLVTLAVAPNSNSEIIEENIRVSRVNEKAIAVMISRLNTMAEDIKEIKNDVKSIVRELP